MDDNKLVWAPHSEEGFVLGHIIDLGTETLEVKPINKNIKGTIKAVYDRVFPAEENPKDVDDNCSLLYLNEATLLYNLNMRFKKKVNFYTC